MPVMRPGTESALRLCRGAQVVALALLLASDAPTDARGVPVTTSRVVVVAMRDVAGIYRFRPETVSLRRGDVLRFVLDGGVPHNVEFLPDGVPSQARLRGLWIGPYLTRRGEAYDVAIDDRFPDGVYRFRCSPHSPFGMEGTLRVRGARPS